MSLSLASVSSMISSRSAVRRRASASGSPYIRPEKIRLLTDGEQPDPGDHAERGTIREVVYAGMITRYVVDLDEGGEVVVVRQNTTGPLPAGDEGKPATVTWDPGATFAIQDGRKEEG